MSYSEGDKFVLEIKEIDNLKNHMILENIAIGTDVLDKLERLDSDYVNEHFRELQDEAYQAGLNDMCELIKKIHEMGFEEVKEIFHDVSAVGTTPMNIIYSYTPQEAISKIEAYEQAKKAEIKVGYIVRVKARNVELIVTRVDTEHRGIYGMNKAGTIQWEDMDRVINTGRCTELQALLDDLD